MTDDPGDEAPSSNDSTTEPTGESAPETHESVDSATPLDTDQWVQIHQAHYDRTSAGELATALVYAIAEAKGVDPIDHDEMPPLYEFIDAQALEESFFGPSGADTQRSEAGVVTFIYTGYKISLRADGWIFVYEAQ